MGPRLRKVVVRVFAGTLSLVVLYNVLSLSGALDHDVWYRETPLVAPTMVSQVKGGLITVSDGRVLRPAGVRRAEGVSEESYDYAIRVMVAQGVVISRDLGDGRAFLRAEPRFYNWCGTRNHLGISWLRWGGSYIQCPLSELLVGTGYACAALDEPGLTPRERWRLEGVDHIAPIPDTPTRISDDLRAFRYGGIESSFENYEEMLELLWKPGPVTISSDVEPVQRPARQR